MDIKKFVNITSKAWALTILSQIHAGVPGRQAPLLAASGASRTAFVQSLKHLLDTGWLEINPGHGHPLRPEYRLTKSGVKVAALAYQIQKATKSEDRFLLRRTWTVPILTCLHQTRHFNEIKKSLPTVTDRALSQSLKSLEERDWVQRKVNGYSRPPRSLYCAVNTGKNVSRIAAAELIFPDTIVQVVK